MRGCGDYRGVQSLGLRSKWEGHIWVVVKIRVLFWEPLILG